MFEDVQFSMGQVVSNDVGSKVTARTFDLEFELDVVFIRVFIGGYPPARLDLVTTEVKNSLILIQVQ